MMKLPATGLRTRILLWHGLLLACVLAAFGITAHRLHWDGELNRVDRELDVPLSTLHRSLHVRNGVRVAPARDLPPPETYTLNDDASQQFAERQWDYVVWNRNGKMLARSEAMPDTLQAPAHKESVPFVVQRRTRADRREAFLITPPGECFLASRSIAAEQVAAAELGWWLAALGATVLGIGLLVDAWILRKAIRPVEDIIDAAERISGGNLSARIESPSAETTELGRLTKVLNRTFGNLEQAFTHQAQFSADVAHELRTPVAVLIAEAQGTLERERSTTEYQETVSATLRSARRMNGLIESLLSLAQIESGADRRVEECDIAGIAAEASESLRSMAATQNVQLRTALQPAHCHADPQQILQVVSNLLTNAIQHNIACGHVSLETGTDGAGVFLSLENSGPGIPAEDLPRVFERFYRADVSRSRRTGGVGLGLAICKAIIEAHGGDIQVQSKQNGPTRFTIRLTA